LGAQMRKIGVSRRRYARIRGVAESTIRKAVKDGRLAPAVLPDGTIDRDKGDELLAASTVAGAHVSSTLSEAMRRKAAASAALLADEVAEMEATLVPIGNVLDLEERVHAHVSDRLNAHILPCAPKIAGQEPGVAFKILMDVVNEALADISSTEIRVGRSRKKKAGKGKALADMTADEIAIFRTELLARRLELRCAAKNGEMVDPEIYCRPYMDEATRIRTNVLGMPSKFAPRVIHKDADRVREILAEELENILILNVETRP
jgi:hypothetical protein